MDKIGSVHLEFDPKLNKLGKSKKLQDGLSVVVQVGDTLWVTNDETVTLERLSLKKIEDGNKYIYGDHKQFHLKEFLPLPVPPTDDEIEEADLEGLDYKDGYLWLVGSHSLKRKKVDGEDEEKGEEKNIESLAKVSSDGNRFLLACIPIVEKDGTYSLEPKVVQDGEKRTPALLHSTPTGSRLTEVLEEDEHLKKFLKIPGKDNGFDIEGLARVGNRIFLGLRGPVLRGWAVILEIEPEVSNENTSKLKLKEINPDNPDRSTYRKHFIKLDGLGIRDMCAQGDDLLILAGPTMDLDGPVAVYRWKGGAKPEKESVVFNAELKNGDIPFKKGKDHAEGMTFYSGKGLEGASLLVVYDSAADGEERQPGENVLVADIFKLPA